MNAKDLPIPLPPLIIKSSPYNILLIILPEINIGLNRFPYE